MRNYIVDFFNKFTVCTEDDSGSTSCKFHYNTSFDSKIVTI